MVSTATTTFSFHFFKLKRVLIIIFFLRLDILLEAHDGRTGKARISVILAKSICLQTKAFEGTAKIQPAVTEPPQSSLKPNDDDTTCQTIIWSICFSKPHCNKFKFQSSCVKITSRSRTQSQRHNQDTAGSTIIVTLKDKPKKLLSQITTRSHTTRSERLRTVADELQKHSRKSQAKVLEKLQSKTKSLPNSDSFQVESIWISNQIFVNSGNLIAIQQLLADSPDVLEIRHELSIPLIHATPNNQRQIEGPGPDIGVQWGVKSLQAPDLWAMNITGQGIIVSNIDTGVRGTHEALKDNFVGLENHGWYDALNDGIPEPADWAATGHGTHTMGIIAGTKRGIGVAPGVKWMACRGCGGKFCPEAMLIKCGQFIASPSDTNGGNKDPSKAPHVVSNSWGYPQRLNGSQTWFDAVIDCWKAAEIIPVFAAGNDGWTCGNIRYPASHPDVITVGGVNAEHKLFELSSFGPTRYGNLVKPDVIAPAVEIWSSVQLQDNWYELSDGTSMACPHVAGLVALLLAGKPELRGNFEAVKNALIKGVGIAHAETDLECGGVPATRVPNNYVGHGRVNALKSFQFIV